MKQIIIFIIATVALYSGEFIIKNDSIVLEKAAVKIEEMSKELHDKTGISALLSAMYKLPEGEGITQVGKKLAKDLKAPYALVVISASDKQVDLLLSKDLEGTIDKDEILDTYIIKLLVSYNKKITQTQKYSAALLNGMAELTDRLAETKGLVLDSSIGNESKNTIDVIAMIVKVMIAITILAVFRLWYYRKG